MPTDLQYMALSDLVYEKIESEYERDPINKIFSKEDLKKTGTQNRWTIYKEHIGEWIFLEAYKPTELLNKKESELTFEEKSFYAAAFQTPNQDEIVIAYRGTDGDNIIDDRDKLLGFVDVDPDFWGEMIITNLSGVGLSIPGRQFELAKKFYKYILNRPRYDAKEKEISFTGHSLGGGLAQYASVVSSDVDVNRAVTWNGIGIAAFQNIYGYEFLDRPAAVIQRLFNIHEDYNKVEKEYKKACKSITQYFNELDYIKDGRITENFLINGENGKEIDEEKLENAIDDFRAKNISGRNSRIEYIHSDNDDYGRFDSYANIKKRLDVKLKFHNEYNESDDYEKDIINYINSYDLTGNFADHIGSTYAVDKGLEESKLENDLASMPDKKGTEFAAQHSLDVFYPYFVLKESEKRNRNNIKGETAQLGDITDCLSIKYLKAVVKSAVLQFCKNEEPEACLEKLLKKCITDESSIDKRFIPLVKSIFVNSVKLQSRKLDRDYETWMDRHEWIDFHGGWLAETAEKPYEYIKAGMKWGGIVEDKSKFELKGTKYKLDNSILENLEALRNSEIKKLWKWIIKSDKKELLLGEEGVSEDEETIIYNTTDEIKISNKEIRLEVPAEGKSLNTIYGSLWKNDRQTKLDENTDYYNPERGAFVFKSDSGLGKKEDGSWINSIPIKKTNPDKKVKVDQEDISGTYEEKKEEEVDIGDRKTSAGERYYGDNIIYKKDKNKLLYLYGSDKKNKLLIDGFKNGDYGIELKDMVPGEGEDKPKTYGDYYKISFNKLKFKSLDKLEINKSINEHTEVLVEGKIDAGKHQEIQDYLDQDYTPLYLTYREDESNILFKGRLVEYHFYREEGTDSYLEARALSNSLDLKRDRDSLAIEKQDRVYQIVGSTYNDIMDVIADNYDNIDIKFNDSTVGEEGFLTEEHPLEVQYHETDWHFLQRIFSEYGEKGLPIIIDDTKAEDETVNIKIGCPEVESIKLSREVSKQMQKGKLEKKNSGCGKEDGLYSYLKVDRFQHGDFEAKDREKELLDVGKTVEVETGSGDKKEFIVIENRLYIPEDGFTLRSDLTLVDPQELHMEKVKRERDIEGLATSAEVKKVKKDHTLQVEYENMESEHNGDAYSYPIDKFYTGEYFAPEKKDIVDIYFGGKDAKDATVKSIRTSVKTINNPPKVKKIRTQEGKEILIDDEDKSITITGKDEKVNMYISEEMIHLLRKGTEVVMNKDGIAMKAGDREITISEDGLIARADGNKLGLIENCILMEKDNGAHIEVKDGKIKVTDGQSEITMGDGDMSINSAAMSKLG